MSRGLGDVYKRQKLCNFASLSIWRGIFLFSE
jgi:hypothetical protein